MIKNKIEIQKEKLKRNYNDYVTLRKSIEYLNDFLKKYYILAVGFEGMHFGISNSKRRKIITVICILFWFTTLFHVMLVTSDDIYSIIDGPYLPDYCRIILILATIFLFFTSVVKTDLLIGEIKHNHCEALKMFYYLMLDIKSKHKINDKNYKRLAIISRIVQLLMLNYFLPILSGLLIVTNIIITIKSRRFIIAILLVVFTPIYINLGFTLASNCCIVYIYYSYFKLRFDQINDKLKQLINSNIISRWKEKRLNCLIKEHNLTGIEIHSMNLIMKRTAAALFITLSLVKIITLYLIMNIQHKLFKLMIENIFVIFLTFGFGVSILVSLQIKSAHNCYKIVYPIVCRGKMRLSFRFKVKLIRLFIDLVNL